MSDFAEIKDHRIEKPDDMNRTKSELIEELNELREKVLKFERSRRSPNGRFRQDPKKWEFFGEWTFHCEFLRVINTDYGYLIELDRLMSRAVMKNGVHAEEYSLFRGDTLEVNEVFKSSARAFEALKHQLTQYAKQAESIRRMEE